VRIFKADAGEPEESWPQFDALPAAPGTQAHRPQWLAFFAGRGNAR
jgi:hypothetical protein